MTVIEPSVITINAADISDSENLIHLQRLAYQTEAELYQDWTIPPLTQTREELQEEFATSLILKAVKEGKKDRKIVGSIRAKLIDNVCHIGRLAVHPDFQRQGIGSELLRKIEQSFANVIRYELFTGSKSEKNIRLYESHGYQVSHTKALSERVTFVYLYKFPT